MFLIQNFILIHFQTLQLIFVYLKMPKEHRNITFPLRTEGKIHYTRPFDMMKAGDRAEVCEFLYLAWLCPKPLWQQTLRMNTGSDVMFKEQASIIYLLLIKLLNYKVYLYLNISDSFLPRYENFSINAAMFQQLLFSGSIYY